MQGAGSFRPGALVREGGSASISTLSIRFHQGISELTRPGELVSRGGGRWGVLLRGASLRCAGVTKFGSPVRPCARKPALLQNIDFRVSIKLSGVMPKDHNKSAPCPYWQPMTGT